VESAKQDAAGAYRNDTTDIIGGSAGIALYLLYAAEQLKEPRLVELAASAGRSLIARAMPAEKGNKWAMTADFPRLMPNFSHGTAGIAYVLAELHRKTGEKAFLDAALQGAEYLLSIANTEGGVCLIFHHEPEGKDLYYLGWCHGPVGTARLFYLLEQTTGDKRWEKATRQSAEGILKSGIPEQRTPGFWNNVSQCCGSAGVVEFFLDLARVYKDRKYSRMAQKMAREVISRATVEGGGARWIQAEHRVQPDLLIAQTGYMQGASGIAMMFLHLDAFQKGKGRGIQLPDSPFPAN
jgi:lantibiotic modifying enzyme